MDYYEKKRNAIALINSLAKAGTISKFDFPDFVEERTGFSEKFTKRIIAKRIEQGFFIEKNGFICLAQPQITELPKEEDIDVGTPIEEKSDVEEY